VNGCNDSAWKCIVTQRTLTSSADTEAVIARVAPAVLALLGDGVPRSRRAIVAVLADRHPRDEVVRTLMRLAVTGRLAETGGKYTLAGT
jgi:hypothetical protein